MHSVKNEKGKADRIEQLQAQITQLQEALSRNVQRNSWIKWGTKLINLADVDTVTLGTDKRRVIINAKGNTYDLPMYDNAHIKELSDKIGSKAVEDAAAVVFGWIAKSLIECGAGILDVEQNLNKLELKGEKPIELTKEMEVPKQVIQNPVLNCVDMEDPETFVEDVEAARDSVTE